MIRFLMPGPRASRRSAASCSKPAAVAAALTLIASFAAAARTPLAPGTLESIQRECLRAYPPELLASMASGAREIPAAVEEDPRAQMRFLDREASLDKGLFYPALLEEVLPAFERYVSSGTRFLDLGSGDGRAVFLANVLGAVATGIEYDEELVAVSRRALAALGDLVDAERVHLVQGDFFASSWADYDVVFYFDQSSFEQDRLREKVRRELAPGARLIVYHEQAPFPGLEREASLPPLEIYRRPAEPRELRAELEALAQGQQEILRRIAAIRAGLRPRPAPAPAPAPAGPEVRDRVFDLGANPVRGSSAARLTLVEFTDYQCPFCARHVRETQPQIEKAYVETGKLRYATLDLPLERIHDLAFKAAEATHCAEQQGRYWEMHDRLFEHQEALEPWSDHAAALGLDATLFDGCLASGRFANAVKRDMAEAAKIGFDGTPSFLLAVTDPNDPTKVKGLTSIEGAQPFATFEAAIDEALAELAAE